MLSSDRREPDNVTMTEVSLALAILRNWSDGSLKLKRVDLVKTKKQNNGLYCSMSSC
jgi:hypothetical protein